MNINKCFCLSHIGVHTVHLIVMKLSKVVANVPAMVLENKKI